MLYARIDSPSPTPWQTKDETATQTVNDKREVLAYVHRSLMTIWNELSKKQVRVKLPDDGSDDESQRLIFASGAIGARAM